MPCKDDILDAVVLLGVYLFILCLSVWEVLQ
jgi:hypothetical protein